MMMMYVRTLTMSISFILAGFVSLYQAEILQNNTPPVIKIKLPRTVAGYAWNTSIRYSIVVSDKEDGESKYDEIPSNEVFVELHYFSDMLKAAAFIKAGNKKEDSGLAAIKRQDCFNCHMVGATLIGPAFKDVSRKYKKDTDVELLQSRIINGSTGIWGSAVMPTHADLPKNVAQQMVRWILGNACDPAVEYLRGAEGSFKLNSRADKTANGVFVLVAAYADHGINDNVSLSLTGRDFMVINPSKK